MQPSKSTNKLPILTRVSYGVGHVLNDLCASMWFTYLLIYFHQIVGLNNTMAGNLLLIGQVADAIATPFVGYESDRTNGFCGYGKRKSWHLIGCICVGLSFPFIFMPALGRSQFDSVVNSNEYWPNFVYYAAFIVIFQYGWASTQISHLALIPELTSNEHTRVELNAIRYAFTVISNIAVYGIAWLLLDISMKSQSLTTELVPKDYTVFRTLVLIVVGIGALFCITFHAGTKEKNIHQQMMQSLTASRRKMGVLCWFKTLQFYLVGVLYMCTRLIVNISQVYLTMYLTDTLGSSKTYIAIIPLIVYLSGFVATFPMKFLNKKLGKKVIYTCGLILICGASVWYWFLRDDVPADQYMVMAAAALAGMGGSTILITSLSLTADLIDENTESGAFVYGAMSFTDKLSNGIVVQIIQILHPCKTERIMTFVPAGFAVLGFIILLFIRKRQTEYLPVTADSDKAPLTNGTSNNVSGYGSTSINSTATISTPINNSDTVPILPDANDPEKPS